MEAMHVRWTRAELVAVRESIELTPLFEGRLEVREIVRRTLRANRRDVVLDVALAERLASHLVPVDMHTAIAKVKLLRAVRDARRTQEHVAQPHRGVEAA
jgi:succinylglutamate desuccinylase